jgi:mannosyltransferase
MSKPKVCVATKPESLQYFLLLLPVGLAAALSFYSIADKSLWLDEAFSVALARLDWSEMWRVITAHEPNMGLYHVLLHHWVQLGTGEFAVRSLSAITAIASIAPVYGIGVRLFGVHTGIIASLLLASNAFFIQYAQEARAYALVLLLAAAASYLFLKAIDKPSVKSWGAYAAIGALSIYAHFFGAWVIAANFVSGLAVRGLAQKRNLVLSNLVIVLLVSPLLVSILAPHAYDSHLGWLTKPSLRTFARFFNALTGYGGPTLVLVYSVVCGYALRFAWAQQRRAHGSLITWDYAFLCSWLFLPVLGSFLFSILFKPIFHPRYLVISLPPLVLIAAAGVQNLRPAWLKGTTALLLLVLSSRGLVALYSGSCCQKENWRAATKYVLDNSVAGDGMVFQAPYARIAFEYYLQALGSQSRALQPVVPSAPWGTLDLTQRRSEWLHASQQQDQRLWLVLVYKNFLKAPSTGDSDWLPAAFQRRYCSRGMRSFESIEVIQFQPCSRP